MTWNQEKQPLEVQDRDGLVQIIDANQPTAPAADRGPEQELHWGKCEYGPCKEKGGVWFCVEDGGMWAYHKPHITDPEEIKACETFRAQYQAKYL